MDQDPFCALIGSLFSAEAYMKFLFGRGERARGDGKSEITARSHIKSETSCKFNI